MVSVSLTARVGTVATTKRWGRAERGVNKWCFLFCFFRLFNKIDDTHSFISVKPFRRLINISFYTYFLSEVSTYILLINLYSINMETVNFNNISTCYMKNYIFQKYLSSYKTSCWKTIELLYDVCSEGSLRALHGVLAAEGLCARCSHFGGGSELTRRCDRLLPLQHLQLLQLSQKASSCHSPTTHGRRCPSAQFFSTSKF